MQSLMGADSSKLALQEEQKNMLDIISLRFSEEATYAIGNYCLYFNGAFDGLYRFKSAKGPGVWEGNSVEQVRLSDVLNKLDASAFTNDTANNITTFESVDTDNNEQITGWTSVPALASKEKHSSIFNKVSTMFKNIRYLYKMLGNIDIKSIGDGTITGALNRLNLVLNNRFVVVRLNGSYTYTFNAPFYEAGVHYMLIGTTYDSDGVPGNIYISAFSVGWDGIARYKNEIGNFITELSTSDNLFNFTFISHFTAFIIICLKEDI